MNIALLFQHKLVVNLQRLLTGFAPAKTQPAVAQHTAPSAVANARRCNPVQRSSELRTHTHRVAPAKVMPLRVVRVVEQGQPGSSSGRLVISGRMADVCAELDRLAAREAAMQ